MPGKGRMRWILLVLCGLLCLAPSAPTAAQESALGWQALGGPGGRVMQLAAAPNGADLYAVAVAGVNRRDDQTQWRDTGGVFLSHALYRSRDGGVSWAPVTNDLIPGAISALYVDPVTGDLLTGLQGAGDYFTRRYGLWRSRDQGASWERVALGSDSLNVLRITRGADGRYLYLGVTEASKYPSSYVYRSADDGLTWDRFLALRYEQRPGSTMVDLVAHPTDPNRLFIATYGGEVYISADAGETWRLPGQPENPPLSDPSGPAWLVINPDHPRTLLVARGRSGSIPGDLTVARSADGGTTWARVAVTGLPAQGGVRSLAALAGDIYLLNTDMGAFRSADGGVTWQPLEGPLNSGGVAEFCPLPGARQTVLAATGYGLFVSEDGGALWHALGTGLPFNSKLAGLLTDPRRPERILAISDNQTLWGLLAPMVLRSVDGGQPSQPRGWTPAAHGLPAVEPTAWTLDPGNPDAILLASYEHFMRSDDAGLSWQVTRLDLSSRRAIAVAPTDSDIIYLGGRPVLRSNDRGATWSEIPILAPGQERQTANVVGLIVDAATPEHLWAGLEDAGVYESTDGGRTWRQAGMQGQPLRWLVADAADGQRLYAGVSQGGIYRWDGPGSAWVSATDGLPDGSTVLALAPDPRSPGTLWAARDGGGIYRSTDRGARWVNFAAGVGDNLAQALAIDYGAPDGLLAGTATAGVWALRASPAPAPAPTAVDARIEVVWPHDWAPVTQAEFANIGLRLLRPASLQQPPCGWTPQVTVWQAVNTSPAEPLALATQRSVDGQPFQYWELNDVDVRQANDPAGKLYFMVRVADVAAATSVWAHGADPRTYFPYQDVPSGLAMGALDAVDARIQIVWPHDAAGVGRPVTEGPLANIAVAIFKHGTRLAAPVGWRPAGMTLYGAWNQEVGRPLAREAVAQQRTAGVITYPVWEFDNISVARATDPANKLYLWVMVDGVETYPTIWTHGADARTFFPAKDEPILGCVP